jgi:hypothetical protein
MKVTKAQLTLAIIILGLALAAMVYLVSRSWSRTMGSYDRPYTEIRVGESREPVVAMMGEPKSVTDCSHTPFSDKKLEAEYRSKCFQEYEYVEFLARYTISFDRNGLVIYKSKAVSP